MDGTKKPTSLNDALEHRLNPIIDTINEHVQQIYEDFNQALYKQMNNMNVIEQGITKMTQVLWGIVNKANLRNASLEKLLVDKGIFTMEELNTLVEEEERVLEETGEWSNVGLNDIKEKISSLKGQ